MFGTFAEERLDEPPVFGLIKPMKSYHPMVIQSTYYQEIISYCSDAKTTWSQAFQKCFKGPGWSIEKQKYFAIPSIKKLTEKRWNVDNNWMLNIYIMFQVS